MEHVERRILECLLITAELMQENNSQPVTQNGLAYIYSLPLRGGESIVVRENVHSNKNDKLSSQGTVLRLRN